MAVKSKESVFIHLNFHPFKPNQRYIQAVAQQTLLSPKNKPTLDNVSNGFGGHIGVKRLLVAYNCVQNIKDNLIPRKIGSRPGPSASTYVASYMM